MWYEQGSKGQPQRLGVPPATPDLVLAASGAAAESWGGEAAPVAPAAAQPATGDWGAAPAEGQDWGAAPAAGDDWGAGGAAPAAGGGDWGASAPAATSDW